MPNIISAYEKNVLSGYWQFFKITYQISIYIFVALKNVIIDILSKMASKFEIVEKHWSHGHVIILFEEVEKL